MLVGMVLVDPSWAHWQLNRSEMLSGLPLANYGGCATLHLPLFFGQWIVDPFDWHEGLVGMSQLSPLGYVGIDGGTHGDSDGNPLSCLGHS